MQPLRNSLLTGSFLRSVTDTDDFDNAGGLTLGDFIVSGLSISIKPLDGFSEADYVQ